MSPRGWHLPLALILVVAVLGSGRWALASEEGAAGDYCKCPFCAEPIRKEAVKCRQCGSAIEPLTSATPRTKRCPDCAHLNLDNAKYCAKYGRNFTW